MANSSGYRVVNYEYDAWGNILNATGTVTLGNVLLLVNENPFRYCGYQFDMETGWYYLKTRYYTPSIARFLTRDPMLNLNRYSYAANNPVTNFDPFGFVTMAMDGGGSGWKKEQIGSPSILGSLHETATSADAYTSYISETVQGVLKYSANRIYHSVVSNSSSRVEAYRKLMDIANRADKIRVISSRVNKLGKFGGIGISIVTGGIEIYKDIWNTKYTSVQKSKAVVVDVGKFAASVVVSVGIATFVPVSTPVIAVLTISIIANTGISYLSSTFKEGWVD